MVSPIITLVSTLLLASTVYAELNLTPTLQEYEGDGVKFTQLTFHNGDKVATYSPPRGWDYNGSSKRLVLRPKDKVQAEATIYSIPQKEAQSFDDPTIKKLIEETVASAGSASTVTVLAQQLDPLMIERKETFLVAVKYNLNGLPFVRSIIFLNRQGEQLRFQLICREADYKELHKAFQGSLFSWQNI